MALKKRFPISNDKYSYNLPFPLEEIEHYLKYDVEKYYVEGDDLLYLFLRIAATSTEVKNIRKTLEDEMRKRSLLNSQRQVVSVDPLHAAKFLTKEQRKELLDTMSKEEINFLERKRKKIDFYIDELSRCLENNQIDQALNILNILKDDK